MRIRFALVAFAAVGCGHAADVTGALSVTPASRDAAAALPPVIDIPTGTQAVNLAGEFAVAGGLLYLRKDAHSPWGLVDGIGLPNLDGKVLPELKGKLTRVYADGNVVAVVDEEDQVFRWDTSLAVLNLEPTLYAWRSVWGSGILRLRKDLRAISYGRRTILNVETVDDRFGDKLLASNPASLVSLFHDNGFTGLMHFYGLSADGKRLFFADNGLTKVFNYEFDLPQVDDFEGVAIASSASMVVILDSKGRFWAKFLDFDWYGSNPMMFEYSYVDEGTKDEPEGFGRIHIPLPTWRQLPPLENATFTSEMGMVTTGHGNYARELRVRGVDASGACGLWTLQLDKNVWSFRRTDICATVKPFVAATDVKKAPRTTTVSGALTVAGKPFRATITGYSLTDSPAHLELVDKAGTVAFQGLLYLVPGWSPSEIRDPGRDGRYKLLYGTVEADKGFESSAFAVEHNLKTFDFTLYGAEDEVVVKELRSDAIMGKLRTSDGGFPDEVTKYLFEESREKGVPAVCKDLTSRVKADADQVRAMTLSTPALNLFGVVTGTRFWYHHGISMIPPLGRMMDWGTRLLYDRYRLATYEEALVKEHCRAD